MRFLRQLAAVTAVVAVVVLIGVAWHHFAPGSFGGQGGTGPHRFVVRGHAGHGRAPGREGAPRG